MSLGWAARIRARVSSASVKGSSSDASAMAFEIARASFDSGRGNEDKGTTPDLEF
jgi:hypothetical protein